MREILIPLTALLLGAAAGWALDRIRCRRQVEAISADIAISFRQNLDLLRPACAESPAAAALLDALVRATSQGTVSMEALRREVALAIQQEHAALRDPLLRTQAEALVQVTQAAACLKVLDTTAPRERLLVQDAQRALDLTQQALLPRTVPAEN